MSASLPRRILKGVRLLWVVGALGFLILFVIRRWDFTMELLASLRFWQPVAALVLLVAGKLLYVEVVRRTLAAVDAGSGFWVPFHAYNVSQLGKYIPGSIWQFVGRYDIYRRHGIGSGHAMQLILLENVLMIGVAAVIALAAAPTIVELLRTWLPAGPMILLLLLASIGVTAVLASLQPVRARAIGAARTAWRHRRLVALLCLLFAGMWILLGLSAYALVAFQPIAAPTLAITVIALFALSYIAGFAVPFAPAGLGVREAVLAIGLTGLVEADAALLLAFGHRMLYVTADLLLAGAAWSGSPWFGRSPAARAPARKA